ncbi:methyl-accepting chemotaxis protein [Reinekea blandensis]|uniref:Methyl-accepting chemotaxis protein (Contains HAMP domain) n=1 Tax=Reinekea blandensis MED297 TaxID=314283 RepID=A4BIR4_9GAMM|nr:methyl-accepting chemotaxis protein [Reinekea blandensis]EAR08028.1 Methyl-accepting chemotaxis protein (contains HAMP domain) [Reinekea sp. MED297] [Reinekea blandensis MED297]
MIRISLTQRIIAGFSLVLLIVIAMSGSAFLSQHRISDQMLLTSTTIPELLNESGAVLDLMRVTNQIMLQHATTEDAEARQSLEATFAQTRQMYERQADGLSAKLSDYPEIQTTFDAANESVKAVQAMAASHFELQNARVEAQTTSLTRLSEFASEFQYYADDIKDLIEEAEDSDNAGQLLNEVENLASQGNGVQLYLIKTLAVRDDRRFATFAQELERFSQLMEESIAAIEQTEPGLIQGFRFYQGLLDAAVFHEDGLFQQHLRFVSLDNQSSERLKEVALLSETANQQLAQATQQIHQVAEVAQASTQAVFKQSTWVNLGLALVSLVVAVLIASTIIISIRRPLKMIVASLKRVADGDLSGTIQQSFQSELGVIVDDVNVLTEQLNGLISQIDRSSRSIRSVAEDNQIKSEQTNQSIARQRSQTESVATAVTEMDAAVREVATHAVEASQEVSRVTENAQINMTRMEQNLAFATNLKSSLTTASDVIGHLSEESQRIGDILDIIQGIAEQTNLLALNAAIEAARAGEQGRGFAVVADEVRTLAGRSQQAANEISGLIESLQTKAGEAVSLVKENLEQADRSVNQSQEVSALLQEMVTTLASIDDKSRSIASASEEQSTVANDVAENIVQIFSMTEDIESYASQAADNSETLNQLAFHQAELISRFNLGSEPESDEDGVEKDGDVSATVEGIQNN